jgi:uncharacterized protein (DUF2126 family)
MPYVISKWSRTAGTVSYNGPACLAAGVTGGRVYDTREEAEADARRLSEVNPIGFVVSESQGEPT